MDEIEKRLREATDACITSYDAWRKQPKEGTVREKLMESVHELRKVAARLEIEIAISERDEMAARPIPIPPHRASRRQGPDNGVDDNIGNAAEPPSGGHGGGHGGGGHGGGFRGPRRTGGGGSGGHRRSHGGGGHGGGGGGREE